MATSYAAAAAAADEEEEEVIPAFAVVKNGVVVRNIFLNSPPPVAGEEAAEEEPPVLVGRHPECHVVVDHPSISRFHLEVRASRRRRRLTVTDCSSVHGTWVSGQKIPANTPVEMVAGDTVRLGASTREYRLHWLSLREAFELDTPLPPLLEEEKVEESTSQETSSGRAVADKRELVATELHQETGRQVAGDENEFWAKEIPSAPPLPLHFEGRSQGVSNEELRRENSNISAVPLMSESGSLLLQEVEKKTPEATEPTPMLIAERMVQSEKRGTSSSILSRRRKSESISFLCVHTGRSRGKNSFLSYDSGKEKTQSENTVASRNCKKEEAICRDLFDNWDVKAAEEKEESFVRDKEGMSPHVSVHISMGKSHEVFKQSISPLKLEHGTFSDKENSALDDCLSYGSGKERAQNGNTVAFENCKKEEAICRGLFDNLDVKAAEEMEESFVPDKENMTPHVLVNTAMKNKSQKVFEHSISDQFIHSISPLKLEDGTFSDEENFVLDDDKENSILDAVKETRPNEYISENRPLQVSIDGQMEKSQKDMNHDSLSPRNLDGDVYSGKENETPYASKVLKPNNSIPKTSASKRKIRRILGSRKENLTLGDASGYASNKRSGNREQQKLSAKPRALNVEEDAFCSDREKTTVNSGGMKVRKHLLENLTSVADQEQDVFHSDKENLTPVTSVGMKVRTDLAMDLTRAADQEQDVYCSDKENLTPVTSLRVKVRKDLTKDPTRTADQEHDVFYSDKENLTPASSTTHKRREMSQTQSRIESEIMRKRVDRIPFQTLLANSSPLMRPSYHNQANAGAADFAAADLAVRLEDELNSLGNQHMNQASSRVAGGKKKVWTMVPDANSFLDDELRKSIKLLQGLKGTRLIVPRIVIRELDCMKRREGLFRRSSKAASILQWIGECMDKESWWTHVQSSSETLSVAPTPPATPTPECNDDHTAFTAGTFNPMSFFSRRSLAEIVSPTPDDHVLGCALLFSKLRSSENIVILSNSTTLRIKAMAEGLLCEGPTEFRETLMNPCSGRFMWEASTPTGPAWSRLDDAALAENYYKSHHAAMRRTPRAAEAAKGLKLILQHNSQYGHANMVHQQTQTLNPLA